LIVATLAVCSGGIARAQSQTEATPIYDELIDGAVAAFGHGDWASARLLFERAAAVHPNARPLRGMGMADFNLHAYARATEELEAALAAQVQPLDAPLRLQVAELLVRASSSVARVELHLQPADATLRVDGEAPIRDARGRLLVDLGRHSLRIEAERYLPRSEVLTFEQAGEQVLVLPPLTLLPGVDVAGGRPTGRSVILRRALLAGGAVSLVTSLATSLRADGRFADARTRCRERAGCLPDEADLAPVHRLDSTSIVALGVGAALSVAAFVLWLTDSTR